MNLYAAPTIVNGRITEVSLVKQHADPHVPPIEVKDAASEALIDEQLDAALALVTRVLQRGNT